MSSPLVGVWELVSDSRDGLHLFTESHYTMVQMTKNRKRYQGNEPTQAEEAEAFRTFSGRGGRYEVSGSTVTFHRTIVRNPQAIDTERKYRFTIEGNRMNWVGIEPDGSRGPEMLWQKVS